MQLLRNGASYVIDARARFYCQARAYKMDRPSSGLLRRLWHGSFLVESPTRGQCVVELKAVASQVQYGRFDILAGLSIAFGIGLPGSGRVP